MDMDTVWTVVKIILVVYLILWIIELRTIWKYSYYNPIPAASLGRYAIFLRGLASLTLPHIRRQITILRYRR